MVWLYRDRPPHVMIYAVGHRTVARVAFIHAFIRETPRVPNPLALERAPLAAPKHLHDTRRGVHHAACNAMPWIYFDVRMRMKRSIHPS